MALERVSFFIYPLVQEIELEVITMLTKLRLIRLQKGLKQKAVATLIGIHDSYLNKIENNSVKPTEEILIKLSKVYEIHIKELI